MLRLCYVLVMMVMVLTLAHARQDFDSRAAVIKQSLLSTVNSPARIQVEQARIRSLEADYTFLFQQK